MIKKNVVMFSLTITFIAVLLALTKQTHAADATVKVTLPTFKVTLNGQTVDNEYRQYPLLVYKGVTYFPMTWNDARFLGLETIWSPEAGLEIKKRKVTALYAPDKTPRRNTSSHSAKIVTSAIKINNKAIDNAEEQYPLLRFRNVTYFPLTWRFAHDEFGWDYNWDSSDGLRITSHNPQLQAANLPSEASNNGVALHKGYFFLRRDKRINKPYL